MFTGDSVILTDTGSFRLDELVNNEVTLWDGFKYTGAIIVKESITSILYGVRVSNRYVINVDSEQEWLIYNSNRKEILTKKTIDLHWNDEIIKFKDIVNNNEITKKCLRICSISPLDKSYNDWYSFKNIETVLINGILLKVK